MDNNEIYYNQNSILNISCYSDCGPIFGYADFRISDNCDKNNESCEHSGVSYDTKGKKYVLAGTNNFYVEDYEVYKIELE